MFTLTVQKCYHPGMEITEAQYERIAPVLPVQRGNVKLVVTQFEMGYQEIG